MICTCIYIAVWGNYRLGCLQMRLQISSLATTFYYYIAYSLTTKWKIFISQFETVGYSYRFPTDTCWLVLIPPSGQDVSNRVAPLYFLCEVFLHIPPWRWSHFLQPSVSRAIQGNQGMAHSGLGNLSHEVKHFGQGLQKSLEEFLESKRTNRLRVTS